MKFFYYPGCSLEGTAMEYDKSTRSVMRKLDVELIEIEDWTCCGASLGNSIGPILSLALPARNLALIEKTETVADVIAPCSACYLNLRRVEDRVRHDTQTAVALNTVLNEDGLHYSGGVRVRHLLDVLANDIGHGEIASHVKNRLSGIRVAPYYGCQALRPFADFDDPEQPETMEPLIEALGAEVHPWAEGARCCGAGLMTTKKRLALELTAGILKAARGSDCIATICPMCRMNLEYYQKNISRAYGIDLNISVLYLPQLIGLALGLTEDELNIERGFAVNALLLNRLKSVEGLGI